MVDRNGQGLFWEESDEDLPAACLKLLQNEHFSLRRRELVQKQASELFGFEAAYGKFVDDLHRLAKHFKRLTEQ